MSKSKGQKSRARTISMAATDVEWTEALNTRRCQLIDKKDSRYAS